MAFAPMGPEASFFEALDQHRASLLAMVKRGAGETPAEATCMASRYSSSVGHGKPGKVPLGAEVATVRRMSEAAPAH